MNRGLYTAATGMSAAQRMLDVTANNLANVSTNAFKADGLMFKDALEKQMNLGGRNIGEMSFGVEAAGQYTDFSQGTITGTGNPLDLAIDNSKGAFKVQTPQGQTRFTRDGAFRLNSDNQLVTRDGSLVLDNNDAPIVIDGTPYQIDKTGVISSNGQEIAKIGIFDGTFTKEGGNLFSSQDAKSDDAIGVAPRSIEGSNVNAVEAMVQMITTSRTFEMAQKAVSQHDELTQKLIQSIGG